MNDTPVPSWPAFYPLARTEATEAVQFWLTPEGEAALIEAEPGLTRQTGPPGPSTARRPGHQHTEPVHTEGALAMASVAINGQPGLEAG
jgi:hypothetical protein